MLDLTPFLKFHAYSRKKALFNLDPKLAQQNELFKLLKSASKTKFGQDHAFDQIKDIPNYQARVRIRYYEDFWNEYWKPAFPNLVDCSWPGTIPFFAVSSGTSSGRTKYIPCSQAMIDSNKRGGLDLLVYHLENFPSSKIFAGKSFFLGGSTDLLEEAPGVLSGDLSGIAAKTLPWWARLRYFPPENLALLKNWEEKIDRLAHQSLRQDIRMLSGVPSWMLILFDKLWDIVPDSRGSLKKIYPNLEMLVHGGVNFKPYHERFKDLLRDTNAELREVYPASEGFIAVADRGFDEGLRMILDHGIFYEFVPVEELATPNPTRHWIGTIEKEINYAVVLSTCAGLWSYVLGDTIKFTDLTPPRLLITGRISYALSAFGEHLIGEEIEDAVTFAASKINLRVTDFSVGAVYPKNSGELGGHLYFVEFEESVPQPGIVATFIDSLDKRLCDMNDDYQAHRAQGFGLKAPSVVALKHGAFAAWMKSRGKLGGQHKIPRIINDPELFQHLREFIAKH